jgi:hypothetical protein
MPLASDVIWASFLTNQMLSRHGSRYPTTGSNVYTFGNRIAAAAGKFKAKDALSFLNSWRYQLGAEILVPKGDFSLWILFYPIQRLI